MSNKIKDFLFTNTSTKQTAAKNTVWLSISNFGGRLIKSVVILYAARVLGTAGYGVFSYAVSLAGFFTLFVDPGINAILIREGAKAAPEERKALFATTLVMKAFVLVASVLIIVVVAPIFSTLPGARALLPFVALMIIFDSTREFLSSMLRAEEKMQWDAAAFLLANLGIVVFGFIFLHIAVTPKSFTGAYMAGTAVGALAAIWFLRDQFRGTLSKVSFPRMATILKTAWPFAITGALGILLTNTDILIISWMRSASEVGIYSAGIRIIQVLYLVPTIIQLGTLPILSRFARKEDEKFRAGFEYILGLSFLASIPLSLGGVILGTGIMRLVFGSAYAVGGLAFSILMIGLSFDYAGSIIANGIFAYDRQKILIISSAIGGVGNVIFDLIFIPRWGIAGSAIATLFAQILSNWYLWHSMKRLNPFRVLPHLKKVVASAAVMAAATSLLAILHTNLLLNIAASGLIYLCMLIVLKEPLLADLKKVLPSGRARA